MKELPVARTARERLGIADLADLAAIRRATARLNAAPERTGRPERTVHAAQLHALSTIHRAFGRVLGRYGEQVDPKAIDDALAALDLTLGRSSVDGVLETFASHFAAPPDRAGRLEGVLMTWLANTNPAAESFRELFDDTPLRALPGYGRVISGLAAHFHERPPFGPDDQPLVAMLRSPAVAIPESLGGQLGYIRERWAALLGDMLDELLRGLDLLAEEERALWLRFHGAGAGAGAGASAAVYEFAAYADEPERFTPDRDWHPRTVVLAKSTHVWLDQLSRRHGRSIRTLDAIPDEELDRLARWGITGLWLIGVWQRSRASERIKRRRGNPEAAASAYSLDDYRVADDLGGEEAWAGLRDRAGARGVRLASDMVPNHMGIDSRWVVEHPEWFLSLPEPPYPAYSFSGADLSDDGRVGIYLEDHYWDGTDAAVVFRHVDRGTGESRYIYHGNDGTSFPWNDTAQLDYLRADVREQVIRTILDVARRFPIIRFDAAMVLARKSIQRLWFPEPGSGGGAIPSRAEHALSRAAFDAAMPREFWRDVVDRVAEEAPGTLLLAEAFWLMEGYFVRTLGMHRVYNSAFMHMLRDERNAEYRLVMKNTLEFDPEVLKRYVNFMNNPDEKTAVEQFGKGDKYFGVATLLATLPGLPMIGHGQVEGFAEKYGMEYRRAYHDEPVDEWLVARHEREIFPLLHRRAQFAEVGDFLLYDFVTDGGQVNEDVFAYSNGAGPSRSLVVYHNRFGSTAGIIRDSAAYSVATAGGERVLVRRTIAEGLGPPADDDGSWYLSFRDLVSGLEFVRSARELRERGLWLNLDAYARHVFLDFREVHDPTGLWGRLAGRLGGSGVPSLERALGELVLEPVLAAFGRIVRPATVRGLLAGDGAPGLIGAVAQDARALGEAAAALAADGRGPSTPVDEFVTDVESGLRAFADLVGSGIVVAHPAQAGAILAWLAARGLGGGPDVPDRAAWCRRHFDDWRLAPLVAALFHDVAADEGSTSRRVDAVRAVLALPRWRTGPGRLRGRASAIVAAWLADEAARGAIGVNRYEDVLWFGAEAYEAFVELGFALEAVRAAEWPDPGPGGVRRTIRRARKLADELLAAGRASGYRVDGLRAALSPPGRAGAARTSGPRAGAPRSAP